MAEVTRPDQSIYEPSVAQLHPVATTPQGTQAYGVERGHEDRDVNPRALFHWFLGLAVAALLTHVVVYAAFRGLNYMDSARDQSPSPLFTVRQLPPEPRVLPNPADAFANPSEPMEGPQEAGLDERELQDRELQRVGLENAATGQPELPPNALAVIAAENPTGPPAPGASARWMLPSESSGGRVMENAQK